MNSNEIQEIIENYINIESEVSIKQKRLHEIIGEWLKLDGQVPAHEIVLKTIKKLKEESND